MDSPRDLEPLQEPSPRHGSHEVAKPVDDVPLKEQEQMDDGSRDVEGEQVVDDKQEQVVDGKQEQVVDDKQEQVVDDKHEEMIEELVEDKQDELVDDKNEELVDDKQDELVDDQNYDLTKDQTDELKNNQQDDPVDLATDIDSPHQPPTSTENDHNDMETNDQPTPPPPNQQEPPRLSKSTSAPNLPQAEPTVEVHPPAEAPLVDATVPASVQDSTNMVASLPLDGLATQPQEPPLATVDPLVEPADSAPITTDHSKHTGEQDNNSTSVHNLVLHAMKIHGEDPKLMKEACAALWSVALEEDQASKDASGAYVREGHMVRENVLIVLLRTMWKQLYDVDMQVNACGVLSVLAANPMNHASLMDIKVTLEDPAAERDDNPAVAYQLEDVVFLSMRQHPASVSIQTKCCNFIWNVVGSKKRGSSDTTEYGNRLVSKGSADLILRAMMSHQGAAGLHASACGAMSCLALTEEGRKAFMSRGADGVLREVMRAHETDMDIQQLAIAAAWNLALSDAYRGAILDACLQSVLGTMAHSLGGGDPAIQVEGLGLIWNLALSSDRGNIPALIKLGALDQVLQTMDFFTNGVVGKAASVTREIQEKGCGALLNLSSCVDCQGIKQFSGFLVTKGVVERVLRAMGQFPENVQIQRKGCGVMLNLANSNLKGLKTKLIERGALGAVVNAMATFPSDADVQRKACGALLNLTLNSPHAAPGESKSATEKLLKCTFNNATTGEDVKFEDILLDTMEGHEGDGEVQAQACSIIWNIATTMPVNLVLDENLATASDEVEQKRKLMDLGFGRRVCEALAKHGENPKVVVRAIGALWALTLNDNENREAVVADWNLASVLTGVMSDHLAEVKVQRESLSLLWSLSTVKKNRSRLLQEGADKVVLKVMKVHIDDEQVMDSSCGVVWNLGVDKDNKWPLLEAGFGELIVQAMNMTAHASRAEFQKKACSVLWNLSVNIRNQVKLMEMNADDAIIAAMQAHPRDAELQRKACGALWNLGIDEGHRATLVDKGVRNVVMEMMGQHSTNASVQRAAIRVLTILSQTKKVIKRASSMG